MKRGLAVWIAALVLAACGATVTLVETPQQAVSTASQKMAALTSAKFDLSGSILESLPPELAQSLGPQAAGVGNISLDITGNGKMQFPDKAATTFQVKIGGITVTVEGVIAGGKFYLKDPQTGIWTAPQGISGFGQFSNQLDPLQAAGLLKTAQSVSNLGDTKIGSTDVHHYAIVPDKTKLEAQLSAAGVDPKLQAVIKDMFDKGTFHIEVWIGKDDHLLRRVKNDIDANLDLNAVVAAALPSGQALPPGTLPSNASIHVTGHVTVDFHDFNSPVTVTVPSVAAS